MKTQEQTRARELCAAGSSVNEIERLLGVARSFRLAQAARREPYSKYSEKKRLNKLPYGTCKLVLHRTRIVQTIYGSIQEYGGFERPEWLD